MLTLLTDVKLTRRQKMCFIVNDPEDLKWSGKNVDAAFNWLLENEHPIFRLEGDDYQFVVSLRRPEI